MSKLDDKFVSAIEEIKECFVVAQAMAKNSFKTGLLNDDLRAENKRLKDGLCSVRKSTEIMEARRFAEQALSSKDA